ncbi:MAG TPA: prolyl oligopeptidase family serine peptidase [Pirellulales bacterium]|nr:prolyl oligopeptidase family serine peptidase [Pirellulales bacterium]
MTANPPPPDEVVQRFEDRTVTHTGGEYTDEAFHYRLLKPAKAEAGKKYPLVLYLHGAGERGSDNIMQLLYLPEQMASSPWREKYPCYLIAPQCRKDASWAHRITESNTSDEPTDQMKVVLKILDQTLAEQPIDTDRLYLTGLSMGGYGSWELAMREPKRFAALVPICGGGDTSTAAKLVGLPIWAFHGDQDKAVPVESSREMIDAIKAAGGHPKYTEMSGVGHQSWMPAYSDPDGVIPWMFEQRRP